MKNKYTFLLVVGSLLQYAGILIWVFSWIIGAFGDEYKLMPLILILLGDATLNRNKLNRIEERLDTWEAIDNSSSNKDDSKS